MGLLFRRNDAPGDDAAPDRFADVTQGVPGRCPECGGFGYIDHSDLVYRSQIQHCRDCGFRWEYRFDDDGRLIEVQDLRTAGAPPEKILWVDLTEAAPTGPPIEDPADHPVEHAAEEPVAEEPVAEEPAAQEPVAQEPAAQEPAEQVVEAAADDAGDTVLDLTGEEQPAPVEEAREDDVYAKSPGEWLRDSLRR